MMLSCSENGKYTFLVLDSDSRLISYPISFDVSDIEASSFKLFNNGNNVPFDYDSVADKIWLVHDKGMTTKYILETTNNPLKGAFRFTSIKNNGNLELGIANKPVVQYRYSMNYPDVERIYKKANQSVPSSNLSLDSVYAKSGYIHPIITLNGDTLTRINPPDHIHHYGMWGPWTHTKIDTTRVDFWNLGQGMGTVLFKEFTAITEGNISASFNAYQQHIDLKTKEKPQVAIDEHLKVTLWNLNSQDRYMLDYSSKFKTPLKSGILFEAYRYGGGIGMRFTERWHKNNCEVLTSNGKNRLTADGSKARWCIVSGSASDNKNTNGILFLSHPKNRMHPEPMRIWPIDGNSGRGDMFFEYSPIRNEEWQIQPQKTYELNYRMIIFDGELTAEEAEQYWQNFAMTSAIKFSN